MRFYALGEASVSSSKIAQKGKRSIFYLDSCIFIDSLNEQCLTNPSASEEKREQYRLAFSILKYGEDRKCEIVTSAFTEAEVCRVLGKNLTEDEQEAVIRNLFALPWIREINFERKVAEVSRTITRRVGTKPGDSIHIATAIRHGVDYFVTNDGDFLKKKSRFVNSLKEDYPHVKRMEITHWPKEVVIQNTFL